MPLHTSSPALDNALVNPACWADERGIHEQLRWLRANRPVTHLAPEGFEPFWSVAKHAHIAFGFGAHVCLGQHLARLEITALFRELLARVQHVELAGEPRFAQSTFVGGLKSLPIRYRMK